MILKESKAKILDSKPLTCFFIQTGLGTAFTYLTSGVFLSGLAILMGAGDVLVSYLSVIINICGVLTLAFVAFLERVASRKRLTILFTVLSRLLTLFIVAIPALVPEEMQLTLLIPTVIVAFTLQAQTTVVLNQWMLGFMDEKKSGRYISLRQTLTLLVTVILSLTAGRFIDFMQEEYTGFVILFAIAAWMGIFEIVLLVRTPDYTVRPVIHKCTLWNMVKLPLKNRNFTRFVIYILFFYLLLNISDSFTMVYMMRYLALPYRTVTAMYMLISLPQLVLLSAWGRISDRRGHEFVLQSSIWLFAGETLFLFLASGQTWYLFIPAAFLTASVANAGFVIAVFNRRYELMPAENRIVYDNFYTAVIGMGFMIGPMIGGAIKSWIDTSGVMKNFMQFAGIRLLYLLSMVGILVLQIVYVILQKKRKGNSHVKN